MKSYATYVRGEEHQPATHGLLTIEGDGIRFESFPEQSAIEKLFPAAARAPDPKINWFYAREEISALTDLQGRTAPEKGALKRVLRAMHVEPNGMVIKLSSKEVVFDCAISVYELICAFAEPKSEQTPATTKG